MKNSYIILLAFLFLLIGQRALGESNVKLKNDSERNVQRQRLSYNSSLPYYEYCVITNRALKDAFTRLITWKRQKGVDAGIICFEDILDSGISGDLTSRIYDSAGKIRQYLRNSYDAGITKYVLFGGNYQILPIRYGSADNFEEGYTPVEEHKIPTDLYFSDLFSKWNGDGDEHYGEPTDTLYFRNDIAVGRLLCTTAEEIENYTDKLLKYELYPGNGNFSYLKKAFFDRTIYSSSNSYFSMVDEVSSLFSGGIDQITDSASVDAQYPSGEDVITAMGGHGYVSWSGYGEPYSAFVKYYANNLYYYRYAIISKQGVISRNDILSESGNSLDCLVNRDYPMIAYSTSSSQIPFDSYYMYDYGDNSNFPNMGQSFTLGKDYGGPAMIGNTRYGMFDISYQLQSRFNMEVQNNHSIGEAHVKAKYYMYNNHPQDLTYHYTALSSNLLGCPEMKMWTEIPEIFNGTIRYDITGNDSIIVENAELCQTDVKMGIRHVAESDDYSCYEDIYIDGDGISTPNIGFKNCLLTLTRRNCLPQIMKLTLQGTPMQGRHYIITKDVSCGSNQINIDNEEGYEDGRVVFKNGSDYIFEKNGTFKFTKNVKIEKGAKLKVIDSNVTY